MNKVDKNRPVSSIKHEDKRAAIPDSAHQGEEQMAISGMPEQNEYDIFRHEFQRVLIAVWHQAGNASWGRRSAYPLCAHKTLYKSTHYGDFTKNFCTFVQ